MELEGAADCGALFCLFRICSKLSTGLKSRALTLGLAALPRQIAANTIITPGGSCAAANAAQLLFCRAYLAVEKRNSVTW